MIEQIKSIPGWQSKTATEILSLLNTPTVQLVDPQLYTWAGVATIAGPQGAEALRLALESNGMGWAVHQLGGSGLQLSHPLIQQALLGFAANGVPGCQALAQTGVRTVSPAQSIGLEQATLPMVESALVTIENERNAARVSAMAMALDEAKSKLSHQMTPSDVVALLEPNWPAE